MKIKILRYYDEGINFRYTERNIVELNKYLNNKYSFMESCSKFTFITTNNKNK